MDPETEDEIQDIEELQTEQAQQEEDEAQTSQVEDEAQTSQVEDEAQTSQVEDEAQTSQVEDEAQTSQVEKESANTEPIVQDSSVTTSQNQQLNIQLNANDEDRDNLSFTIVDEPSNGQLGNVNPSTNTVTYTPDEDYSGEDNFTFIVNDGTIDSNEATVSITVEEEQLTEQAQQEEEEEDEAQTPQVEDEAEEDSQQEEEN